MLISPDGTVASSNLGSVPYDTILKGLKAVKKS